MIIVTGAAGFIGSCMVTKLNNKGHKNIILVDDFSKIQKSSNTENKRYQEKVERGLFFEWLSNHAAEVDFIFHLGARTDTTEFNMAIFDELNLNYSKKLWSICTQKEIPLVYASSAATYGDGALGYNDHDPGLSFHLKPLNPYGISKNEFDKWVMQQTETPPHWYGLKFFNVFGPNEYHKGRMASVVFHAYRQIVDTKEMDEPEQKTGVQGPGLEKFGKRIRDEKRENGFPGSVTLFRSHNPLYKDGEQLRDFIYVKDVTDVMYFLMDCTKEEIQHGRNNQEMNTSSHPIQPHSNPTHHTKPAGPITALPANSASPLPSANNNSGIYNLGTGRARTFLDLVNAVFAAVNKPPKIEFIDTPPDIRDKYQYFTEANMQKLRSIGYSKPFYTLEAGIEEYVQGYLIPKTCY